MKILIKFLVYLILWKVFPPFFPLAFFGPPVLLSQNHFRLDDFDSLNMNMMNWILFIHNNYMMCWDDAMSN